MQSDLNFLINAFFVLMIVATLSLGLVLYRFRHHTQTSRSGQYFSWYFASATLFWLFLWLKVNLLLSMGYAAVVELYILSSMFLLLAILNVEFTSRISKAIIVIHLLICAIGVLIADSIHIALLQAIYALIVYSVIVFSGLKRLTNENDWGHGLIAMAGLLVVVVAAMQLYGALRIGNFGQYYPAFIVLLALPILLGGIGLSVSLLNTGVQQLSGLILRDPLTRLFSRRGMVAAIEIPLALLRRNEGYLGAIAIEIVDYQQVCQHHGIGAGERLLVEVAKVLKVNTRDSDIVARLEGENFMVLLPGESEYTGLVAERLKKAVENASFSYANADIFCTPNVGFASQFANKDFNFLLNVARQSLRDGVIGGELERQGDMSTLP